MKKLSKRILALFSVLVICFSLLTVPAHADISDVQKSLWDWVKLTVGIDDLGPGKWWRDLFAPSEDPTTAYDAYTNNMQTQLGATELTGNGQLVYRPPHKYFSIGSRGNESHYCPHMSGGNKRITMLADCEAMRYTFYPFTGKTSFYAGMFYSVFEFVPPISGTYTLQSSPFLIANGVLLDGPSYHIQKNFDTTSVFYLAGAVPSYSAKEFFYCDGDSSSYPSYYFTSLSFQVFAPTYFVTPAVAIPVDYHAQTRPTSLVGNLGYYGDDGKLVVAENAKLVDETNNTIYNPVTNTTSNITNWTYDYANRSYNLTLEGDKSSTVTYGDEYVTIKEGDTIYNIYYVTQGGGSTDPDPGTCTHNYTSITNTEPTCTTPGKKTFTCTLCKKTYPEAIAALGHTWIVDRTVQTTYDESGALLQKGYTIYKCSVCNEQYKDESGTGPPGPPGGGGGGSEDGKESIWDKIGKLLGGVGNIFITIVEATIGKLLDGLIALIDMVNEKIESVVNAILGLFDRIPQFFGGFTAFLTAVFPFLPQEFFDIIILTAALVCLIFIIKFCFNR